MAEATVTKLPARPLAVDVSNPLSLYLDTGIYGQIMNVSEMMAKSALVPAHLRGKPSDCWLIVSQAMRWKMDPFAVAQHTFVTQGKLGYEGKLVAAVVNASGKLKTPLSYKYEGSGDARKVTVSGTIEGETTPREITGAVAGWKTSNEKWAKMPDQMLAYRGAREWARRHMPEAVLGVTQTDDELPQPHIGPDAARDVTPAAADLDAALAQEAPAVIEPETPAIDLDAILADARTWGVKFKNSPTQAAVDELLANPDWTELHKKLEQHSPDMLQRIAKHFTKDA
jgi:hypothetical protein